jgi:hypothetical protein
MSRMSSRTALLILLVLTFSGCFSTHLTEDGSSVELARLVQSAEHRMSLTVHNPHSGSSHGYQFLLGIVPLARVFADTLSATVSAKLQYHAGVAGIGLKQVDHGDGKHPHLEVVISSVSINGYDALVFRRPSAFITLRGSLSTASGARRTCEESAEYTETTRFAFAPQLNQVLTAAVSAAAEKLIYCLGLGGRDHSESTRAVPTREWSHEP